MIKFACEVCGKKYYSATSDPKDAPCENCGGPVQLIKEDS